MSSDLAIDVQGLSKCYNIYDSPQDRLKQFVLPRVQHLMGGVGRQYFREFWALLDINFSVEKGEAVGIVGRNGSGKSTLLQLITGTLNPTAGTIKTTGRIAALLELGSGFNPEFTGRENVYLNGSLLGLSSREITELFDDIAGFADIGSHIDQPVKTYSSGMLVRLAFALQVQVEPDILIVDEALAVGDWLFQKRCFKRLEKLTSQGTTLLFVSHDQESVRTLTSRALLLSHGKALAWGQSSDVVRDYRRLLLDEETRYLGDLIEQKTASLSANHDVKETAGPGDGSPAATIDSEVVQSRPRSASLSFGSGGVIVEKVQVLNDSGEPCTVFFPGDEIRIRVSCHIENDCDKLNIAVQIRNKEHLKIYSWGTLNQDMERISDGDSDNIFWKKSFKADCHISVDLVFTCSLGVNFYEVQASVSFEGTPDYREQRILHWKDEAAFFQISQRRDEYFFGGICDLNMRADW
jgi:lipopolysaccharide transport system ATP-binding protein